ncbi:MAG: thiamine diphosphokinase [Euryarchaeota archaeon]|nr:thiamine diphosphokinase [Euryarchaeota archaeon]
MRAILWCNGLHPSRELIQEVVSPGVTVFGVDGGADIAAAEGIEVAEVLGDMDSVDKKSWDGRSVSLPDQSRSDLSKSVGHLFEKGFLEIDIIGVDGGSQQHILGNWAALFEVPAGPQIRMHHENHVSRRFHPDDGEMRLELEDGCSFSVFSFERNRVWITGSRWDVSGEVMGFSTRGLSNEGAGGTVSIRAEGVLVVISRR